MVKTDLTASGKNIAGKMTLARACLIGVAQTGALLAGISRSGITIVSGLFSGLDYEDAARFSFLLATPIIFGAGLIKIPDFFSSLDNGVRGQILAGGVAAFIAAYITVRYLDRYFKEKTLRQFAYYCMSASIIFVIIGIIRGHF
jgi:undecaprenyl-diphosphatase